MTLDEAIKHCQDIIENQKDVCAECRTEHKQLMKWLQELKEADLLIENLTNERDFLKEVNSDLETKISFLEERVWYLEYRLGEE